VFFCVRVRLVRPRGGGEDRGVFPCVFPSGMSGSRRRRFYLFEGFDNCYAAPWGGAASTVWLGLVRSPRSLALLVRSAPSL
jgi:hypothetical protein